MPTEIIYNVTTKVAPAIHTAWLQWQQQQHIPAILATGCFYKATILRLLEQDESEGPTYAVQYHAASMAAYDQYINRFAALLRKESHDKWGHQYIAFRTLMQVVH